MLEQELKRVIMYSNQLNVLNSLQCLNYSSTRIAIHLKHQELS